jgi:hypothetical protein
MPAGDSGGNGSGGSPNISIYDCTVWKGANAVVELLLCEAGNLLRRSGRARRGILFRSGDCLGMRKVGERRLVLLLSGLPVEKVMYLHRTNLLKAIPVYNIERNAGKRSAKLCLIV